METRLSILVFVNHFRSFFLPSAGRLFEIESGFNLLQIIRRWPVHEVKKKYHLQPVYQVKLMSISNFHQFSGDEVISTGELFVIF